jgi:hypothetical protein
MRVRCAAEGAGERLSVALPISVIPSAGTCGEAPEPGVFSANNLKSRCFCILFGLHGYRKPALRCPHE